MSDEFVRLCFDIFGLGWSRISLQWNGNQKDSETHNSLYSTAGEGTKNSPK